MPRGLEVLSTTKHALALHWEIAASLGGNKRLADLALSHRVPGITKASFRTANDRWVSNFDQFFVGLPITL